ncbi:class I SAM-dependent methyltransferase [Sphingomonas lutea]|uniref:Class I SAM-dependent methyltransferase n=1 Tax=Sphingomonas lutea TaxID=1045317 RepID=A0A7G9SI96_9SPHN|nr:class I SAM-dependent methyltransferase [Sphingomonas lutea]QNN67571.1 class I SAM-dependent methyltransferase [Sphingomonas lutea]
MSTVTYHPHFGPAMPSLNWTPAPRYVLRRDRILRHLRRIGPCRILDIGCGPGALVSELRRAGYDAHGVDRSAKAIALGRHLQQQAPGMELRAEIDESWQGKFDVVMSFEVIEHLAEDVREMRNWRRFLRPGGQLIVSTPAHQRRWNAADEWAGHVRRYERDELIRAVESAGFNVVLVETYGFPLANLMERLCAPGYRKRLAEKARMGLDTAALTDDSGSDRSAHARFWPFYASLPGTLAMRVLCQVQRLFVKTQLGPGFILIARRREG